MGAFDCWLGTGDTKANLMLYEDERTPKGITSSWVATDRAGGSSIRDEVWDDWSGGIGDGSNPNEYAWGENVDPRSEGMALPAGELTLVQLPTSQMPGFKHISDSFSLGGHYYVLCGRYALKLENGYGTPTVVQDTGTNANLFGNAVLGRYSGTLFAWIGCSIGTTFTRFDGTDTPTSWNVSSAFTRRTMATAYATTIDGVSHQRLWSAVTDYSVKFCSLTTDPMTAGNWSPEIVVGGGAYAIGSMPAASRHVYVSTIGGGVYDINDLGETLALTPYHAESFDAENGLNSAFFSHGGRAYVLYTTSTGIDAIDVTTGGYRHPAATPIMPLGEHPMFGRVTAVAFDQGWAVVAVYNNHTSYILYGRPRGQNDPPGRSPWIWHGAMAVFGDNRIVSHMRVRSATENGRKTRRLWIATDADNGSGGGDPNLFWQSLPRGNTPKQDLQIEGNGHRFFPGYTLYMQDRDWSAPSRNKQVLQTDVGSERLTNGNAMAVYWDADGTTATTPSGAATISPLQTLHHADTAPSGLRLAPRIVATSTPTSPAILRSVTGRAVVDEEQVEVIEFDAWFAKGQPLGHQGLERGRPDETSMRLLTNLQNRVTTFHHPALDQDCTVLVEGGMTARHAPLEKRQNGSQGWGRKIHVRLRVLEYQSRYDSRDLYDVASYSR